MKNKFQLASLAMIVALVFSLISCSKDKIDPVGGSPSGGTASSAATNGIAGHEFQQYDHDAVTTGALIMQIGPAEAKAIVRVFSNSYNSGPIGVNANNGLIRLETLEPGVYTVQIDPINTEYAGQQITDIMIQADTKTNLGTILLGN